MDIRVLRYFLAAAEQQSISGAAQKLHVTQPTLSRQFMELEEELGHTLFVRSNRKLRLTPKGELFYERARSIVNLFDRTKEEIRAEGELTGDIRIAAGETPALGSLARAIARLQQEAPKVRFHIVSGAEAQVKSELHSGLTDFGVFVGIADTIGYSSIKLRQKDVWGVLTRIDGRLQAKNKSRPPIWQDSRCCVPSNPFPATNSTDGSTTWEVASTSLAPSTCSTTPTCSRPPALDTFSPWAASSTRHQPQDSCGCLFIQGSSATSSSPGTVPAD